MGDRRDFVERDTEGMTGDSSLMIGESSNKGTERSKR